MPEFADKKILLLTERVQELMLELQSIKSSTCDDNKSMVLCSLIKIYKLKY